MSLRYWNSVGERLRLSRMVTVAAVRLSESSDDDSEEEEVLPPLDSDDSSLSDPSSDDETEDKVAPMDISGVNSTLESQDTVDILIDEVVAEADRIFAPMEAEDIDFNRPFVTCFYRNLLPKSRLQEISIRRDEELFRTGNSTSTSWCVVL